jgi:hypothetical protein
MRVLSRHTAAASVLRRRAATGIPLHPHLRARLAALRVCAATHVGRAL